MDKEFAKEPLQDYAIISDTVGKIGYEFCDETIEIFRGLVVSWLGCPENKRPDFKEWVKLHS